MKSDGVNALVCRVGSDDYEAFKRECLNLNLVWSRNQRQLTLDGKAVGFDDELPDDPARHRFHLPFGSAKLGELRLELAVDDLRHEIDLQPDLDALRV